MSAPPSSYRNAYRAGFVVFGLLLLHAFLYYRERMSMPDSSFYLFDMMQGRHASIIHRRFISVVAEWLPLAGVKFGAPIQTVALLYSVSFPLFYLICYVACGRVFRSPQSALALLCYLILFITHTAYWCISELNLGIALLFVVMAYGLGGKALEAPPGLDPVTAALFIVIGFAHPLLLFVIGFMILFCWLRFPLHRRFLAGCGIQYIAVMAIKTIFFREAYEEGAMSRMKNFVALFPDYFRMFSNARFAANALGIWSAIPLSAVAISSVYITRRSWKKMTLFWIALLGYLLLVNVTYPERYHPIAYIENLYLPIGFFIALPLVFDVWPGAASRPGALPAFAILAAICVLRIWNAHAIYSGRVSWLRRLIHAHEGRKVILESWKMPQDTMMFGWSMPFDAWLLSTIDGRPTASIVLHEHEGLMPCEVCKDPKMLMLPWTTMSYNQFPGRYFSFKDTTSTYVHLWEWPTGSK